MNANASAVAARQCAQLGELMKSSEDFQVEVNDKLDNLLGLVEEQTVTIAKLVERFTAQEAGAFGAGACIPFPLACV